MKPYVSLRPKKRLPIKPLLKKIVLAILAVFVISAGIIAYKNKQRIQNKINAENGEIILTEPQNNEEKGNNSNQNDLPAIDNSPLPSSAIIKMPFIVQAPYANWDQAHEEACEEASLIMVNHYLNKTSISEQQQSEKEILDLIDFENKSGYGLSITLEELARIAKSYFGLKNPRIVNNVTKENIEAEIANGKPVIIPAAGKILPNPNFRNGGPNYHMLVIKGYNDEYFITNDPGTKNGEGFKYKFDDLINAIHNWNPENILNGEKAFLVFD